MSAAQALAVALVIAGAYLWGRLTERADTRRAGRAGTRPGSHYPDR